MLVAADEIVRKDVGIAPLMVRLPATLASDHDVASMRLLLVAALAKQLKDGTVTIVDSFVGEPGQVETRELARETIALVIAAMFVAQRPFAPWSRAPVHALGGAAIPTPVNARFGQCLVDGGHPRGARRGKLRMVVRVSGKGLVEVAFIVIQNIFHFGHWSGVAREWVRLCEIVIIVI